MWHYLYRPDGSLYTETDDDAVTAAVPAGFFLKSRAARWNTMTETWDPILRDFKPRDTTQTTNQALLTSLLLKPATDWTNLDIARALRLLLANMGQGG